MPWLFSRMKKNPDIVSQREPLPFVGLATKTDMRRIYKDAARLGKAYAKHKKEHGIPNLKEPWAFVAYSRDFDEETKSWEYIIGDVVTELGTIPEGLGGYEIPPATYAVFQVRSKFGFLWGLEIARMKRYVFGQWLPASPYESTGCDFGFHDERSTGKNSRIELFVGIEEPH